MPRPTRTGAERHALGRSTGLASLWAAVVAQALSDAVCSRGNSDGSTPQDRAAARAFLRGAGPGWREARDAAFWRAGIDPLAFETRCLSRLEGAWLEADAARRGRRERNARGQFRGRPGEASPAS